MVRQNSYQIASYINCKYRCGLYYLCINLPSYALYIHVYFEGRPSAWFGSSSWLAWLLLSSTTWNRSHPSSLHTTSRRPCIYIQSINRLVDLDINVFIIYFFDSLLIHLFLWPLICYIEGFNYCVVTYVKFENMWIHMHQRWWYKL